MGDLQPQLGRPEGRRIATGAGAESRQQIGWVIVGGESGAPGGRQVVVVGAPTPG